MLQRIIEICSSDTTLFWIVVSSDLAIAAAYFAIPATMAIVLRHRRQDIPYPWLWLLFVAFIVACGLTHLAHVVSAFAGVEYLRLHAFITAVTAMVSVGTALAFAYIIPQIKDLPSPLQQRAELERLVCERTQQKDALIREINHRIGNQLQIISSVVHVEQRRSGNPECLVALDRIKSVLKTMSDEHARMSMRDYLEKAERRSIVSGRTGADGSITLGSAAS
ncbi:MAG: histidine kinase dimerization/phosphoacceptor domain -containing protein [Pseudomonadota bacterium]